MVVLEKHGFQGGKGLYQKRPDPQSVQAQTGMHLSSRRIARTLLGLSLALLLEGAASSVGQNHRESFDELAADALFAREHGDIPRAIELYQQATQLNPRWPDGWWYLGSLQYGASAYVPAIDALTHYIELTPDAGPARALRGLCEFEVGQYPQSLQDIQEGIALGAANQPRNAGIVLYHEALLLTRLGRFEEALGKYGVMVQHGTIDEDVTKGIGLAGLRMPIFPKDIDPSQAQLITMVGRAAATFMSGDLAESHQAFDEVFTHFPAAPNVHYFYAYLLFPTDPEQAIGHFQKELANSPRSALVHAMLAWAFGMQGDYQVALSEAQKALAEDPSLSIAQLVLGRDLMETGDVKGALPHLETVVKTEPRNPEAHIALAKAYSELGRRDDARRERLLCLALSSHGTDADANR
jgi:tetratricopeptide (TPR) repeat protein